MITPKTIRTRRQKLAMTQIEVAIAVGVSVPAYRLWEAGGVQPTPENEAKLRQVLQLGRDDDDSRHKDATDATA